VLLLGVVNVVSAGKLYGLSVDAALVSVDANTGAQTPIGSPVPYELVAQQLSTVDADHQIFYFIAYNDSSISNSLVGLDMKTGNIIQEITLPFTTSFFVGVGEVCEFDPRHGDMYVMGYEAAADTHHILRVHLANQTITEVTTFAGEDVLGGAGVLDPLIGVLWVQLAFNISGELEIDNVAFNITDGSVLFSVDDIENLETMDFDPTRGAITGIGVHINSVDDYVAYQHQRTSRLSKRGHFSHHTMAKPADPTYTRTLLNLSSRSGKMTILANIPNYFIIDAGIGALDTDSRTLYSFMQVGQAGDFFLVGVDADTGAIKTQPDAGTQDVLPWSLHYA